MKKRDAVIIIYAGIACMIFVDVFFGILATVGLLILAWAVNKL